MHINGSKDKERFMLLSFLESHTLSNGGGHIETDAEKYRIQVVHRAARVARVELEVWRHRHLPTQNDAVVPRSDRVAHQPPVDSLRARWQDRVPRPARI